MNVTVFRSALALLLGAILIGTAAVDTAAQDPFPKANTSFAHREGKIVILRGKANVIKSTGVLSKDGRYLFGLWATGRDDRQVIVYDLQLMKEVKRLGEPLVGTSEYHPTAAVSADEKAVATGVKPPGTIKVFDVATGKEKVKFTLPAEGPQADSKVSSIAFSPDGDTVYAATFGGVLSAWSIRTEKLLFQTRTQAGGNVPGCRVVAATHDGKHLVGVGHMGYVRILDAASGKEVNKLDVDNVPLGVSSATNLRSVLIAANDRDVVFCDTHRGIWHLDLATATVRNVAKTGANEYIAHLAISASGDRVMYNDSGEKFHAFHAIMLNGKPRPPKSDIAGSPDIIAVSLAGDRVLLRDGWTAMQWGLPKK